MHIIKAVIFFMFFPLYITDTHAAATLLDLSDQSGEQAPLKNGEALIDAVRYGDTKKVLQLIETGHSVNKTYNKENPLHVCVIGNSKEKKIEIMGHLIKAKADVNATQRGLTPLHFSALRAENNWDLDVMEKLLQAKADTEIRGSHHKQTALEISAQSKDENVSEILIAWGAQPTNQETQNVYWNFFQRYQEFPSRDENYAEYQKKLKDMVQNVVPVKELASLIIQYIPHLHNEIGMNKTNPPFILRLRSETSNY